MPTTFRILLIDDDPLLKDIIERASKSSFPEAQYNQVHSLEEARQYIEALDGYGPKLIFLDLELENTISGFDFLGFLRSHVQARLLPVIILTRHELSAKIKASYELGANSFTIKPFNFDEWVTYLGVIQNYWANTATIPQISFRKQAS